jgi:hypothetical protein
VPLYERSGVPGSFPSNEREPQAQCRAADDFEYINSRIEQLEAECRLASEKVTRPGYVISHEHEVTHLIIDRGPDSPSRAELLGLLAELGRSGFRSPRGR